MDNKPQFIARKFQNAQRLAAKGYLLCPLCDEKFQEGKKLWAHGKIQHHQASSATDAEEARLRKHFLQEATEKTQQSSRNFSHNVTPFPSKPSSNDNDSMRPNVGEDIRSGSPQGPNHDPGSIHDPARKIDDLAKLTLSQDNTRDVSNNGPAAPSLPYTNPLKRGVADGCGQSDPIAEGKGDSPRPRARRAKAQSGGPYPTQTSDHSRDHPVTSDSRVTRTSLGSGKRLFDPTLDSPVSNTTRTNHNSENAVTHRHFDEPRAHAIRSRKMPPTKLEEPANVNFIQGNRIQQQPVKIMRPYPGSAAMDVDQFSTKEEAAPTAAAQEDEWMPDQEYDPEPVLLLQPETRPISHDQLVVEVKGIYAGLVLVESKCIDVDQKQSKAAQEKDPARQTKLTNEQWQALIHLHKTLLHEHHDFFLASQHPSASPALSKLAAKYSMPARMWHHGIHAFLEVLRHRLPESLDHMLAFIYIAYSMMALLYETVSTFEDTWIECLGDLGRYRMAIEDDDQRDREVWSGVSRFWYSKAADKCPDTGRLYHHLAILARPYTLQQLCFYTRSLTCMNPFGSARSSIMTLFNPILNGKESAYHRSASMETIFIKAHATLFCNRPLDEFEAAVHQLEKDGLDNYVGRVTSKFKEQGVFAMVANISALFEYGAVGQTGVSKAIFRIAYDAVLRRKRDEVRLASPNGDNKLLDANDLQHSSGQSAGQTNAHQKQLSVEDLTPSELEVSQNTIGCAARLTFSTLSICLQRVGDKNVWPLVHVSFVFLWSLTFVDKAMKYVESDVPWGSICSFLNNLAKPEAMTARIWANDFPQTDGRPLPEDFQIRGQLYSQWYFRDKWFDNTMVDDEERTLELPSMTALRVERILWLGMRIATLNRWITYEESSQTFQLTKYAIKELDTSAQSVQTYLSKINNHSPERETQQPLTRGTKPPRVSTDAVPLHRATNDTTVTINTKSVETAGGVPIKTKNHNAPWMQSSPYDQAKSPPQKQLPTKHNPSEVRVGAMDDFDAGLDDLTNN